MVVAASMKPVHEVDSQELIGDVVFIHGLNSNARDCWTATGGAFWPSWLAEDLKDIGVWTIDYGAAATDWFSERKPMPIYQRAINLLELLNAHGLGKRPLIFITHSMGGLMAKQMLRHASTESKNAVHQKIGESIRGVVFIATPHRGSKIADWLDYFRLVFQRTIAVSELQVDSGFLVSLADWFEVQASNLGIKTLAFSETRPTSNFMVVSPQSAEPGNVQAIPLDANHIEISKPTDRSAQIYGSVLSFLQDILTGERAPLADLESYRDRLSAALNAQFPPTTLYFPLTLKVETPSPALDQPSMITSDESLTTLLRSERRIYLRGAAGSGKSRLLGRLARELFSHSKIPIFINLKSWTESHFEELKARLSQSAKERFDVLLSCSIVEITVEELDRLQKTHQRVVIADGLNEAYGGARSSIVRALDDWVRSQGGIEPAVVISDRLNYETGIFDSKWSHYEVQPLSAEVVREQIAFYLDHADIYSQLSVVDQELLSSPYFFESVLRSGKLALGSAAGALEGFFIQELGLSEKLLEELAQAAFTVMRQHRSLSFPKSSMQELSDGLLEKLLADGVLIVSQRRTSSSPINPPQEMLHFDHQLKHDYLSALILAQDEKKWERGTFDDLSFKGASFNTLAMALQMMPSLAEGDRFLERVYDWSWPGALMCLAEAAKTGIPGASEAVQWMLLGVCSEKLFDPILPTRQRARYLFQAFEHPPGSVLKQASTFSEATQIISELQSTDRRFTEWKDLFLCESAEGFENTILNIREQQSILGWTLANVLRRLPLSESDFRQLRQMFRDTTDRTIRWRIAHALGAFPTRSNAELLLRTLEEDEDHWVRYGAARAALEAAARVTDPSLQSEILGRIRSTGPGQGNLVKGEIRRALYNLDAPERWGDYVMPILTAIRFSLAPGEGSLAVEYERSIEDFRSTAGWRNA